MNKSVLERVGALISTLTPQEISIVENTINATRSDFSKHSKLLDLLTALLPGSETNTKQFKRKLIELLENRILDALLMDVNLLRNGKYLNTNSTSIVSGKESLKVQLLISKGLAKRAYQLAETCIKRCKEHEDYQTLVSLLNQQLSLISFHSNHSAFLEKLNELARYEEHLAIKRKTLQLYRELMLKKHLGISENLIEFVEQSLVYLARYESSVSFNTLIIVKAIFEKEQYELEANIPEALQRTVSIYNFCYLHPHNAESFNIYEIAFEQARLCYILNRLDDCTFLLEKAILKIPIQSAVNHQCNELLFVINFKAKNFKACENQIHHILKVIEPTNTLPENLLNRWRLYDAIINLESKKFTYCIKRLESITAFEDNLQNLQVRILKIIALIELEKLDETDKSIEAFRKFVTRNQLATLLAHEGLQLFFDCIKQLKYCGYNFSKLPDKMDDLQTRLSLNNSGSIKTSRYDLTLLDYSDWIVKKLYKSRNADAKRQKIVFNYKYEENYVNPFSKAIKPHSPVNLGITSI